MSHISFQKYHWLLLAEFCYLQSPIIFYERMRAHPVVLRDGTNASIYQAESGDWACPVCGSVELKQAPYFGDGAASFEMCSCGFEFGFDDDPGASATALSAVQENWARWRIRFLSRFRSHSGALAEVAGRLRAIGVHDEGGKTL